MPATKTGFTLLTFLRILLIALIMIGVALFTLWGSLALWFHVPGPEMVRGIVAGAFALLGLATLIAQIWPGRLKMLAGFAAALIAVSLWWQSINPPLTRDWAPDDAVQVTGTIEGDRLTLDGVRNFDWRTEEDFTPNWERRSYDLSKLQSADLVMSHWDGPSIAHMIVSFGFEGDEYLAWSAEVRHIKGSEYSPLRDAFKNHTLVLLAGDERDLIGLRTNIRGEDVQLYRINAAPANARALLVDYVEHANALATDPKWYNSLTTNCTTVVMSMIRQLFDAVPMDWRILVNGYMPEYAYDLGALDTRLSFDQLQDRAHVTDVARDAGLTPTYSTDIRKHVPDPLK
ncbi:Lnb N-terminal periplasmic domain-containing protein [Ruegeria jejuensis]|uniref:Lnb N-terminal periplasmic domain-containing protein n=1 Tax=Ruegeria jejuensis TaxID=3233338 RepID=UPI00355B423B